MASIAPRERPVKHTITSIKTIEGGGFVVRRPFPIAELDQVDPFLMLDHMGPVTYAPGEAVGAPDHPHRGFETVSYVISGGMQHKDSVGNSGELKVGDVQWMTAGSGIVHSEMPSDDIMQNGGTIEGFQLWVNLPKRDKMVKPRYQDIRSHAIPEATNADGTVRVRVIAGESMGKSAVIETRTPIMYLDIHLLKEAASHVQSVPSTFSGFVYVYRGKVALGKDVDAAAAKASSAPASDSKYGSTDSDAKVSGDDDTKHFASAVEGQLLILAEGDQVTLTALEENTRLLLIAGEPIREKIARHGPFVMNTREELVQAFQDYRNGVLGSIDGAAERAAATAAALQKQRANHTNKDDL